MASLKPMLLRLLGIAAFFSLWFLFSSLHAVNPLFLPSPAGTISAFFKLLFSGGLLGDLAVTLVRILSGFVLAGLVGIPIGFALALSPSFGNILGGPVDFLRYVPAAAYIPLSIVWLGVEEPQKIFVIFLGTLPFIVLYTARSVASVEKKYLEAAHLIGIRGFRKIRKVVLPAVSPDLWDMLRIELGGAWALVIVAELIAATSGIGHRLALSQRFLETDFLFAEILFIALVGFCFDMAFRLVYPKLFPWSSKVRRGLGATG